MGRGTRGAADVYATVVRLAREAAARGTFGVGGVLADDEGRVLARAWNAVVAGGCVRDPTAHVERQLVDWYFAAGPRDVEPGALTIVSSLEPCMMCAGAILRAGLRCVGLADDEAAGVGIGRGTPTLPPSLCVRAATRFARAAVAGRRPLVGEAAPLFRIAASAADLDAARAAFESTREHVQRIAAGAVAGKDDVGAPVGSLALDAAPDAEWTADGRAATVADLGAIAAGLAGDGSAAGLADAAGRLVYVAAGATDRSPIRTAVVECVRGFTRRRSALERALDRRLAPVDLTLVLDGGGDRDEEGVVALGAAGSFVEAPLPAGRAPFVQLAGDAPSGKAARLGALLDRFPSFYRDFVGLRVGLAPRAAAGEGRPRLDGAPR